MSKHKRVEEIRARLTEPVFLDDDLRLSDSLFMLDYIAELELETTTTRVSCEGCGLGFRPRELYDGKCALCWSEKYYLLTEMVEKAARLDDAF